MIHGAKIVTVCNRYPTEPYYCLDEFIKSLRGIEPLVLGTKPGEYGGLGSKPRLLYRAIKEGAVNTKWLIFTDCWDVVFAVHPEKLFAEYLNLKSPFVISAEKNCFPATYKEDFDKLNYPPPYKYVNSGMIVAETDAMLSVLESMDAENIPNDYFDKERGCMVHPNDQEYYQREFVKQPVTMTLDYEQRLSATLHDVAPDELDFSGEKICLKYSGVAPASFHLNGGSKTSGVREPILKHLGYL